MLRRNVLIFHQGALGDFILTWPLAMALSRLYPQSRIVYVTHGQKGALAERVLRVDCADVEGGWHQLYSDAPKLPEPAARLLAGAHSIFSFVAGADQIWTTNARTLEPEAQVTRLEPRPPADYRGHFTDFLVEQLRDATAVQAATIAMLGGVAQRGLAGRYAGGNPVIVHPGSGGEHKCWPRDNFLRLVREIKKTRPVRVILGEAEFERWPADEIYRFEAEAEVVRPKSLVELYEQLAHCSAAVMNDSGPAHLAGIIGVPTVCLFGPSNPTIWRPLGPRVSLVHNDPLEDIEPRAVSNQLNELLGG